MNVKTLIAASLFAVANVAALSTQAAPRADIHKVISIVEAKGDGCGVIDARMTYLDSKGQQQVLDYSKFGDDCQEGS